MKKLILIMLCLVLIPGANASTREGLKQAFDEFNYSLNVEWDQTNQKQYGIIYSQFASQMKELYAQGLTREEMINFLKAETVGSGLGKDLETIMNMVEINKMSEQEAFEFITQSVKQSQAQGASWAPSSGKVILIVAGVIATLFISYVLLVRAYEAVGRWVNNWGSHHECRDEYICREDCYEGNCQPYCNYEVVCY